MSSYPTDEAWDYFTKHLGDIRDVVESFQPVNQMQSMAGSFGSKTLYTMEGFDKAVVKKDSETLNSIMNDAWLRAPEDRRVYGIPGFSEMCNLLDCTVDGFFDTGQECAEDGEEEPAF
jgi:hypothetical protein